MLAAIVVLGWAGMALWPVVLRKIGFDVSEHWYLDSMAILAALDAVRGGFDPYTSNPLDLLHRGHVYSDWWLTLRWLGLGREHNFIVGTAFVLLFVIAIWVTARVRTFSETAWLALVVLSPPFLLAVFRANNDLVIFSLLALCGYVAGRTDWVSQVFSIGVLVLAVGLKYYPVVGVLAYLWVRPVRRMPWMFAGACVLAVAALISVWSQMARGRFPIESTLHVFGAPLLAGKTGWAYSWEALVSLGILSLGACCLVGTKLTTGLAADNNHRREGLLAALGSAVMVACFIAGVSYAYRWLFVVWMALWMWRRAHSSSPGDRGAFTARIGGVLLLLCLWLDGVYCLIFNTLLRFSDLNRIEEMNRWWQLATQPIHWALMMLFAGWLLEGILAIGWEWLVGRRVIAGQDRPA